MPWWIPALAAGAFLGGAASSKQKTSQRQDLTNTSTPTFDPRFAGTLDALAGTYERMVRQPTALPASYTTMGIQNANQTADAVGQAIKAKMAASGLGGTSIAANAQAQNELARGGNVVNFLNSVPLAEQELRMKQLAQIAPFLALGRGETTRSVGTVAGTQATNPFGSGASSALGMLGFLYGQGAFGQPGR